MTRSPARFPRFGAALGALTGFAFGVPAAQAQVLALPACTQSGNCTLDDIVRTGAAFANLLTEISAALFFATFIYGGAMYILSFGDKGRVEKGKKALTGAAIGMAIVMIAWTLVNYIAGSLTGKL